jgi:hypothetical protein
VRYPDNVVTEGEQVVLHRHPHWKCLIGAVLVFILATGLAVFVSAVVNAIGDDPLRPASPPLRSSPAMQWGQVAKNMAFAVIWGIWLVVVGWLTLGSFVKWLTTHFVVTNRRVMFRRGFVTRSGIDISLARVTSVKFRDRIVERMFRTGTLIIESASADPLEFYDIPRLREVHALLYHEVFDTLGSEELSS